MRILDESMFTSNRLRKKLHEVSTAPRFVKTNLGGFPNLFLKYERKKLAVYKHAFKHKENVELTHLTPTLI